jgi:hypothetical protein
MTQNLIETVFAKIRAEYPHYPATKPVIKSTIIATLEAIREPSEEMLEQMRIAFYGMTPDPQWGNKVILEAWDCGIDALRAEIESAE